MKEDKTVHNENDRTVRLAADDRTARLSGGGGMVPQTNQSLSPHRAISYQLNNNLYHSLQVISDGTGEAQVFLVEHKGRPYVLKLYYPEAHPNRQILNILKRIGRSSVLVELIDYGTYMEVETGKERDYELMEYAGGGSLAGFRLEKNADRLRDIAMQAAISLDFCHQNGIIHRDVKPANFLFLDESHDRLVLSDFGIAMYCADPTRPSSSEQARTPVYAAPELYQHVIDGIVEIDRSVDFYSLGMVLLCLWSGEDFIRSDERNFMKQKSKGQLPYPDDLPAELLVLLRGLTVVDPSKRWGFDEIKRWYRGEEVPVESDKSKGMNIVFNSMQRLLARSPQELALLMKDHPDLGIKYLYSGQITRWLYECDLPDIAIEVDHIVEKHCPKNQEVGLRAACHTIDPGMPYLLECGKEGQKAYAMECSDIGEVIRVFRAHTLTQKGQNTLLDYGFLAWLSHQNEPIVYEELKRIILSAETDALFDVIYALDKRISFTFYFPDEADKPDYCFSAKQIAEYINGRMASAYYRQKSADHFTGEGAEQPDETLARLYAYFRSKDWKDAMKWVQSCFDFDSTENKEKCSSYTPAVAAYRAIKGLGHSPYYVFPKCGKKALSPEELSDVPQAEIEAEMERGRLKEWLTVFYHEDPYITFNQKYDYEKQVKAYLLKLKELNPAEPFVQRYMAAKAKAKKSAQKIERGKAGFVITRALLTVATFLPLLALAALCVLKKFPVTDSMFPLFPWEIFLGVFVASAFWEFATYKFDYWAMLRWPELRNVTSFYYLLVFVFYVAPNEYGWVYLLCVPVGLMIHVFHTPLSMVKIPHVKADKGFGAEELEPLYYAFKDTQDQSYQSSQLALNTKKGKAFSKATRRFVQIIVPTMVVAWALLGAYIYYHPAMSYIGAKKLPGYERYNTLQGSYWRGFIEEMPVVISFDRINSHTGEMTGTLGCGIVEYYTEAPIKGVLDTVEGKLTFTLEKMENPVFNGTYTCTFDAGNKELAGVAPPAFKDNASFVAHRQRETTRLGDGWRVLEKKFD